MQHNIVWVSISPRTTESDVGAFKNWTHQRVNSLTLSHLGADQTNVHGLRSWAAKTLQKCTFTPCLGAFYRFHALTQNCAARFRTRFSPSCSGPDARTGHRAAFYNFLVVLILVKNSGCTWPHTHSPEVNTDWLFKPLFKHAFLAHQGSSLLSLQSKLLSHPKHHRPGGWGGGSCVACQALQPNTGGGVMDGFTSFKAKCKNLL